MELPNKTKRIYQYLLANKDSRIMQLDISSSTNVSPQLVNKVFSELKNRRILTKVKKNAHLIVDYEKLLMIYSFSCDVYSNGALGFYCGTTKEDAEGYLQNSSLKYSLALHSAASKRINTEKQKTYAYVLDSDIDKIKLNANRKGNLIVFPRFTYDFYMCGKIDGIRVTPIYQTIADLLSFGDYENARKLAGKFGIEI